MKSNRGKKNTSEGMAWHPDFRDASRLPDLKVVRTSFFVNSTVVVILAGLLITLLFREYEMRSLDEQAREQQEIVDARRPQNQEAIELSRAFREESGKIEAVSQFMNAPLDVTELLAMVARTVPDRIVLNQIRYEGSEELRRVTIAGTMPGLSGGAADTVAEYEAMFGRHEYFSGIVERVDVSDVNRNPNDGTLSFNFVLRLNRESE